MEKFIEVKVRVLGPHDKEGQLKLQSLDIGPVNKGETGEGVKINLADEFDVPNSNEYRLVF